MSQHDQNIANASGASVRADINSALAAIFGLSSGATAPGTTIAYQLWADTTNGLLQLRNAANSAWIVIGKLASVGLDLGFAAGTRMLFQQTAAPTGWTKETNATYNDAALRFQTGTVTTGGADAFSTHFGTSKSTAAHTLTIAEMPSHDHTAAGVTTYGGGALSDVWVGTGTSHSTNNTGGGGSHSHTLNSFNIKFADCIIATKD